jgi:hypothetical protein
VLPLRLKKGGHGLVPTNSNFVSFALLIAAAVIIQ